MLEYSISEAQNVICFELTGKLQMGVVAQRISKDFKQLCEETNARILLDMRKLHSIDSSGIGTLVIWKRILDDAGGIIAVLVERKSVPHMALEATSLDQMIPIFSEPNDAIQFIKFRYLNRDQLQNFLIRRMLSGRATDKSFLLDELHRQFPLLEDAVEFLERALVMTLEKEAGVLATAAMSNQMTLLLAALSARYSILPSMEEKTALLLSADSFLALSSLMDFYLRLGGWSTINASGAPFTGADIRDMEQAHQPSLIVLSLSILDRTPEAVQASARMLEGLSTPTRILYAPELAAFQSMASAGQLSAPLILRIKELALAHDGATADDATPAEATTE